MSDNIKLVIEIPKKEYEAFKELIAINIGGRCSGKGIIQTCLNAVKNGIPLDDVKAKILQLDYDLEFIDYDYGDMAMTAEVHTICREEVMQILDNIGKAESEDK